MDAVPHHWDANSGEFQSIVMHERHTKLSSDGRRCEDSRAHLRARHVEPERQVNEKEAQTSEEGSS